MGVRKRTWQTKTGPKTAWIVDYFDSQEKRHIKTFAKMGDAKAYDSRVNVDVAEGTHTPPSKSITVAKAADQWLANCENPPAEQERLERATVDSYRQHVELHIKPHLGTVKLSSLTAPLIAKFESDLKSGAALPDGTKSEKRSSDMVRRVLITLGAIISDAMDRGEVAQNVVHARQRRRRKTRSTKAAQRARQRPKIGRDIPSPDEIRAILTALDKRGPADRWRPLILTAAFTGLRASELRGLRWGDLDLDTKPAVLHVRQRADKYKVLDIPKSDAGERDIELLPDVVAALRQWWLLYPTPLTGETSADGKPLRAARSPEHFVFPSGNGQIEDHGNIVHRGWGPIQIEAGVTAPAHDRAGKPKVDNDGKPVIGPKYPGLHSLRHFFASWCISPIRDGGRELSAKQVQKLMGHSTIVLTMDTYADLFEGRGNGDDLADAGRAFFR